MPEGINLVEVKSAVDGLATLFEGFKAANDERYKGVALKADLDPVIDAKVKAASAAFEVELKKVEGLQVAVKSAEARADLMEAAFKRGGNKAVDEANEAEIKQFASLIGSGDFGAEPFNAYSDGFKSYLRTTRDRSIDEKAVKALTVGGDVRGGFWVPPAMSNRITTKLFETSPIRSIANVQTIGSDRMIIPIDRQEADAGWVGEVGSRTETTAPELGEQEIPVHEMYANPRASQTFIDDAMTDVAGWLNGKVIAKMARLENTAFVTGNGIKKPRGFLDYAAAAVTTDDATRAFGALQYVFTGVSGGFHATLPGDTFISIVYKLKAGYRQGARWVMNRATLGSVRTIKDGQGNYLWTPNFTDLQNSAILGFGVTEAEDMTAIAASSYSIAFGNFNAGYQIVDRQGVRLLVDPYSAKPYVQFYTTKRTGGDVTDSEAIKLMKFATS